MRVQFDPENPMTDSQALLDPQLPVQVDDQPMLLLQGLYELKVGSQM